MKKIRLGDLLLAQGIVTKEDLERAYNKQSESGEKLGRILVEEGLVQERQLFELLAKQLDLEFLDLSSFEIDKNLALSLSETYARRYRALILGKEKDKLLVGLADPMDVYAFDELSKIIKQPLKRVVVCESLLLDLLSDIYRHSQEISQYAEELSGEVEAGSSLESMFATDLEGEDAPVVRLLLSLFKDAVQAKASDIHIEPGKNSLRIRLRVDGILQENVLDDVRIARPLVQRLKMRSGLDISEKRVPQDGRFDIAVSGKAFDVRVSTMPTVFGESVVMRLLDQSSPVMSYEDLGMNEAMIVSLKRIYSKPHGMLLVTGPTGSGKTTTLYSILNKLNTPERKIITAEDPVEYRLSRINQVQVNRKIDLDFSRILRTMLRQDPDVIMVGEIRDHETAQIALRAALTGHFVLATIHTNDVMTSAFRLIDMGVEGYMVASSINGVLAQRLVRRLCPLCSSEYEASTSELKWLNQFSSVESATLLKAEGCHKCYKTGYQGRIGVYELLEMNHHLASSLRANDTRAFADAVMTLPDHKPIANQVFDLVFSKKTSMEEAIRVLGEINEDDS